MSEISKEKEIQSYFVLYSSLKFEPLHLVYIIILYHVIIRMQKEKEEEILEHKRLNNE
jgi:hypothetical protein